MADQKLSQIEQHNTTLLDDSRFYTVSDPTGVAVRGYTEYQDIRDQILISTANTIYVDKNGVDTADGAIGRPLLTIQAAIDSITDASSSNKYVVHINPGTYTEAVTTKDGITLLGEAVGAVTISQTAGTTLTVPSSGTPVCWFQNIIFKMNTSESSTPRCAELNAGFSNFMDCTFDVDIDNGVIDGIELAGATGRFNRCIFLYTHTGTSAGATNMIHNTGAGYLVVNGGKCDIDFAGTDSSDYVLFYRDTGTSTGESVITTLLYNATMGTGFDGHVGFWKVVNYAGENTSQYNLIHLQTTAGASNSIGYVYDVDSDGNSASIHSIHNYLRVEGNTLNYSAEIDVTDTVYSHFDDIVAADGKAKTGTYHYVNSPSDGDLQISGSYLNMYDNMKTVGIRGQDYTAVQDAIDAITDAATDKRYVVLIYPGTYTENVDLTGKPFINLIAVGSNNTTYLTSATGTTLTLDDGSDFTAINLTIRTTGGKAVHVPSGLSSSVIFDTCVIQGSYSNTYKDLMEIGSGSVYFISTQLLYLHSGTGGGTHRVIYLSGASSLTMITSEAYVTVAATADDLIFIDEANVNIDATIKGNILRLFRSGIVTGETTLYYADGTYDHKDFEANHIRIVNSGSGGIAQCYKTHSTGTTIHSVSNKIRVADFTTNYIGNILTNDTLLSHFDDIVAADNKTGGGTYDYVNSPSDGDLQISGSYLDMYDQALTVGKRGADHTVIQDAIDAITDASASKRYVILLYPGTYTENVVLSDYIDLKAVSTRSATVITSSSGTTLTLADQATIITGIKIQSTGGKILEVPAVATTIKYRFDGGSFRAVINDSYTDAITVGGGNVQFSQSFVHYIHTGTGGGTHRLFNVTGPAILLLLTTDNQMSVEATADDVVGIAEADEVITTQFFTSRLVVQRSGVVTGETIGYLANGTSSEKLFSSSYLELLNNGSGGTASFIKTSGNGCVTTFQANTIKVQNHTLNYFVNTGATDIVYSNFDTVTTTDNFTGTGTFNAVHAHSNGDFHVNRDILLTRNIEVGGALELASGTTVNEITTTVAASGGDDSLVTEKALVNWTNGLAAEYMPIDGSVAFTNAVPGVIPTLGTHLTTKTYVDAIVSGGGSNDVGPFVSAVSVSPSGGEAVGEKWIVAGLGGAWSGYSLNDIAEVDSITPTVWSSVSPSAGNHGWVTDEGADHTFDGTDWSATGTLIDHTTIQNIGVNTHAVIDTHIANITTNPHSVDSTDVGLGNVTNDAQLKRGANDWITGSGIAEKVSTVDLDRFLIEDAGDSQAKKYVLMKNIVDRQVAISSGDTVQNYLENKLIGTASKITVTKIGAGGDEDLQIDIGTDVTGAVTHVTSDGKNHSDVVLNNTHRASDGKNHSDVVLNNTHRASDGKDHSDVVLNNTDRHTEAHTIASHSDTTATGTELETLTDGSNADTLHVHLSGWHGSETRIKIAAAEFLPNDSKEWKQVIENDGGSIVDEAKITEFITGPIYIPTGYQATAYMIYASANLAVDIVRGSISSSSNTSLGTGNANTEVNMTNEPSTTTNYLSIVVVEAGSDIYGGYVTIEAV